MSESETESSLEIKNALISIQVEEIQRLRSELRNREKMLRSEIEQREGIIRLLHDYQKKNREVKQ